MYLPIHRGQIIRQPVHFLILKLGSVQRRLGVKSGKVGMSQIIAIIHVIPRSAVVNHSWEKESMFVGGKVRPEFYVCCVYITTEQVEYVLV